MIFGEVTSSFQSLLAQRHLRKYSPLADHRSAEAWLARHYEPARQEPTLRARMKRYTGRRFNVTTGEVLPPGYSLLERDARADLIEGLVLTFDNWNGREQRLVEEALHSYVEREAHGIVTRRASDPEGTAEPGDVSSGDVDTPEKPVRLRLSRRKSVRMTQEEYDGLEAVAKARGQSISKTHRQLVTEGVDLHKSLSREPKTIGGQGEQA